MPDAPSPGRRSAQIANPFTPAATSQQPGGAGSTGPTGSNAALSQALARPAAGAAAPRGGTPASAAPRPNAVGPQAPIAQPTPAGGPLPFDPHSRAYVDQQVISGFATAYPGRTAGQSDLDYWWNTSQEHGGWNDYFDQRVLGMYAGPQDAPWAGPYVGTAAQGAAPSPFNPLSLMGPANFAPSTEMPTSSRARLLQLLASLNLPTPR